MTLQIVLDIIQIERLRFQDIILLSRLVIILIAGAFWGHLDDLIRICLFCAIHHENGPLRTHSSK
jgi:hypothetical protein